MDGRGRGRSWMWGGAFVALMVLGTGARADGLPEVSGPAPDVTPSADHVRSATEPPRFDPSSPAAVQARKEEAARPKPPAPKVIEPAAPARQAPARASAPSPGNETWVDPFAPAPESAPTKSHVRRDTQPDTAASAMPPQTAAPAAAEPEGATATTPPPETATEDAVRPSDSAMPAEPPAAATAEPAAPAPRVIGVDSLGNSSEPPPPHAAGPAAPPPPSTNPDGPLPPSF